MRVSRGLAKRYSLFAPGVEMLPRARRVDKRIGRNGPKEEIKMRMLDPASRCSVKAASAARDCDNFLGLLQRRRL